MRWLVNGFVPGKGALRLSEEPDRLVGAARALMGQGELRKKRVMRGLAPGVDPNDIQKAGWRLVVAKNDGGRAIAKALEPLVAHRVGPKGDSAAAVLELPAGLDTAETVTWVEEALAGPDPLGAEPPEYVLMAGGPDELSFDLQHLLATRHSVGRVAFGAVADYGTYATKVRRWEPGDDWQHTARTNLPVALFGTDHDDITHESRQHLVDAVDKALGQGGWSNPIERGIAAQATSNRLKELLSAAGPRLLFSATHGLQVPAPDLADIEVRRQRQGALVCQATDWIEANELGAGPVLHGGMAFIFACFGGGTPVRSDFLTALFADADNVNFHAGGPFVAALPTALLANPEGPLAVVAHLDPSFMTAITIPGAKAAGGRARPLFAVVQGLLDGFRVGACTEAIRKVALQQGEGLRQLTRELEDTSDLATLLAEPADSPLGIKRERLIDMALSLHDFRNFIVLGDPAAKLPLGGAKPLDLA